MKKVIFALAAVVALAACSKEQTVVMPEGNAIGFNTFVDKATRSVNDPSLTSSTLQDFAVFGYVEGAELFDGTKVAKTITNNDLKSDWRYEGTQYWIAGANYNFNAVAPYTNGGWTKADGTNKDKTVLSFTNNGTTDLLYATTVQEGKVSGNTAVEFQFRHVLSKVKFSFENGYNATNATIKVKDIVITNPHKTATAVLTGATVWDDLALAADDDFTLDFGMATDAEATTDANENVEVAYAYGATYESQNERFLIPSAEYEYVVTFTVDLYINGTQIDVDKNTEGVQGYNHTAKVTFAPVAGNAYDIKTVITPKNIDPQHKQEPIEFTVATLPGWGTTNDVEADGDYDPTPEQ
ncbi:MAG: fimbrillin family protein [Alistipes sp.]|nr:fimbrillin family protein [Alistipes sp.]